MRYQQQDTRNERIIQTAIDNPDLTYAEIGQLANLSAARVGQILREANVERPNDPRKYASYVMPEKCEDIARQYVAGAPYHALLKEHHLGKTSLDRILQHWGVEKRKPGRPRKHPPPTTPRVSNPSARFQAIKAAAKKKKLDQIKANINARKANN